jgi:hypothetical protein
VNEPAKPPSPIGRFFAGLLRTVVGLVLVAAAALAAWKLAFDLPTLRFHRDAAAPTEPAPVITGSGPAADDNAVQVAKFATGSLSRRDQVKFAQAMLQALDFDTGPVDGLAGGKTLTAVRAFQADRGLVATGTINRNLLEELAKAVSARGRDPMEILKAAKR